MKLAIQTNVWSDALHKSDLAHILSEVAQAGYDGLEIGLKRLDGRSPQALTRLAKQFTLRIIGIHTGAHFDDPGWHANLDQSGTEAAAFAAALSAPFLLVSGQRSESALGQSDLAARASALNRLGRIAQRHGVALCFHNHDWEFKNNAAELEYLLAQTDPALVSLQLDVGWVHRARADVPGIVRTLLDRTRCYHLKDDLGNGRWTEVGSGVIPWDSVFAEIAQNPHDPWLIVERDEALPDALASASASARYVRQRFGAARGGV